MLAKKFMTPDSRPTYIYIYIYLISNIESSLTQFTKKKKESSLTQFHVD